MKTLKHSFLCLLTILTALAFSACGGGGDGGGGEYNIYGRVATEDGVGLQGVTMEMTISALYGLFYATVQTTTDADGRYAFANSGYITTYGSISPSMQGDMFTPASRSITITPNTNISGQDFVATRLYSISGKVTTVNGVSMPDVEITFVAESPLIFPPCTYFTGIMSSTMSTWTINNGNYSCYLPNGTYIVTPSKKDFTFTPSSRTVTLTHAVNSGHESTHAARFLS